MIKTAKNIFAALMAMTVAAVLSVCANAALLEPPTVEGELIGGVNDDGSMTIVLSLVAGTNTDKSVNYVLKGEALEREFWNRSDAYVEVDLTLETESDTVSAIIPAFAKGWKWVNPSVWGTQLKVGQTVTIREPLSTYYTEFKNNDPMVIRVQFVSSSPEMENVQISMSGIRFVGVEDSSAEVTTTTTTTIATTTLPEESEDIADDPVESVETAEQPGTEENSESEPAVTTASSASDNNDKDSGTQTEATSSVNDGTKATSTRAPANVQSEDTSIVGVIVVIVIVAVVVVAGAVVGYIIYRKKKYY
ncbi:MAG: hypothetical protein ACI4KA_00845 [Oscillospiraceae bacterium]